MTNVINLNQIKTVFFFIDTQRGIMSNDIVTSGPNGSVRLAFYKSHPFKLNNKMRHPIAR